MANAMEFWGIEVKGKEPCEVALDQGYIIHVSQITLGDAKKDKETVTVHVKVGDKKLVMGILSQETPQLSCDLVFDDDFEISHNWKNGTIHLLGYQAEMGASEPGSGTESGTESDSDEEEVPIPIAKENGQLAAKVEPKAEEKDDSDEEDSSEDDESDDEGDDDSEMMADSDDESDDELEDSDDEKPVIMTNDSKKRSNADASTPKPKKAKIATPSKTDSKKGKGVVHPGTPHPNKDGNTPADSKKGAPHQATPHPKKGGNTPAGDKSPKSGGSNVSCGSCKKTFKSEVGLQSHTKDKHGAK